VGAARLHAIKILNVLVSALFFLTTARARCHRIEINDGRYVAGSLKAGAGWLMTLMRVDGFDEDLIHDWNQLYHTYCTVSTIPT
jgi:hypothetical protein